MAHDVTVPGPFPDDHGGVADTGDDAEILQVDPPRWEQWWKALPARRRRAVLRGDRAGVCVRARRRGPSPAPGVAGRSGERREFVSLDAAIGVWSSSSTPPGGQVTYYVALRNASLEPLEVTSVAASNSQLRLRARDVVARPVAAGEQILVPLSAMLTCSAEPDGGPGALRLEVGVHREGVRLGPQLPLVRDSALLLDAAHTLCGVRPTLTDHELSGPVLQTSSADTCPAGRAAGRQGA